MAMVTTGSDDVALPLAIPVLAGRQWGPGADLTSHDPDALAEYLDQADFQGELGQVVALPGARTVYLVGVGEEVDLEALRKAAGSLAAASKRAGRVSTTLHHLAVDGAEGAVAEGFVLGSYSFDRYRSDPGEAPPEPGLHLIADQGSAEAADLSVASAVANAVNRARDLVNTPASDKGPEAIAKSIQAFADRPDVRFEMWTGEEVIEAGFGGLAGVNAGSARPATMLRVTYRPDRATRKLAMVGKGIVFDSGGLTLKPYESMKSMKTDMAGAAAVLAAFEAIVELAIPIEVIAITPLTENLPSGTAVKPGDVLTARNGKTMEVLNTDAEGRLVLADGLSLAAESDPDLIVDLATLTGACVVALGRKIAGLFAPDDEAAQLVEAAAARAGERVWRLPLPEDYRPDLDSEVADMKNVAGHRYGGAIHAALFLKEFVGDRAWAHLDIAGPSWPEDTGFYQGKGASGFGVRTLVQIARDLAHAESSILSAHSE